MKHLDIFEKHIEKINRSSFEKQTLEFVSEVSPKSIINEKFIMVYHGTKMKNYKSIIKSGMFKEFSFFALDFDTAKRYSMMVGNNNGVVIQAVIYSGSLIPIGEYLTSNENVYFKNSVYVPKGYEFK